MSQRFLSVFFSWPIRYFIGFVIGLLTAALNLKLSNPMPFPFSERGVWVASVSWGFITAAVLSKVLGKHFQDTTKLRDRIIAVSAVIGSIAQTYAFQCLRAET